MPAKTKKTKSAPTKSSRSQTPVASRPLMPAVYGTRTSPKGMLAWSWARERLANSHNYVVVTVRPNGRPHAMGMHGVWFEDAYYFSTGDTTRKAKNLEQNAHSIVINERLDELVIVEGETAMLPASALPQGLATAYKKKYGWGLDPRGAVYKLAPQTVFAIPEKQFATACTRWKF